MLRPKIENTLLPLIITPHDHNHPDLYAGITHNEEEKTNSIDGERDIAIQAINEGYIVIAPETRAFGSTRPPEDKDSGKGSSCTTQLMHDLLVKHTPIGERVWDMELLIDWAITRLNVDESRIAMTGNSDGGTMTLYAAACDERIAVAMPGSYFRTFKDTIGIIRHCDCNYVPGILRLGEMYDIGGALDQIFPIESVRYAYQKLKETYDVVGHGDDCQLYVGEGVHRYYKKEAWPFVANYFK